MAARREALRVAARAVERRLNAHTSDHSGPTAPRPSCGRPARYVDRRAKTFTSVLGPLTPTRAYYHCKPCAAGFCPRDRVLGPGRHVAVSGGHAHGRAGGRDGQLRGGPRVAARVGRGGRADHARRASGRGIGARDRRRRETCGRAADGPRAPGVDTSTWGWMVRGCRCARRSW